MKTKLDLMREFYNGRIYPLIIMLLAVVANATGQDFICYLIATVTLFIGCLVAYDLRFVMMQFMCTVFFASPITLPSTTAVRENLLRPFPLTMLILSASLLIAGIVIFCIRNRRRINPFPWKGMFLTLAILSVALCLNGAFNPAYEIKDLLYALTFPAVFLILYTLFALYIKFDRTAFPYFMYTLMLACSVICLQLICRYLSGAVFGENGEIVKEQVILGWAVWTTLGGMISMLMPATFYFAATAKRGWIFYLIGLLQFFCTVLSQSRGATLIGAGTLVLCMGVLCFCGRNRRVNRWITLGIILLGIAGALLLHEKLIALLQNFINMGFGDNGRFDLWKLAFSRFVEHPIFGAGFYDNGIVSDWDIQVYPHFYHNTIMQMMGSVGILGLVAYLWHRIYTVRAVFTRPNVYKAYLALCILSCLMFCMLDVLLFITYPLIFYTLILLFIEKNNEVQREEGSTLSV